MTPYIDMKNAYPIGFWNYPNVGSTPGANDTEASDVRRTAPGCSFPSHFFIRYASVLPRSASVSRRS